MSGTSGLRKHGHTTVGDGGVISVAGTSPCRAATTANITISTALNNGDTLDGVTLAAGDRVLVKDQSTGSQNGIYIVSASPARADDYSESIRIVASVIVVSEGTTNGDTAWLCTTNGPVTVGTTALVYAAFGTGGGQSLYDVLAIGNDTQGIALIATSGGYLTPSQLDLSASGGDVKLAGATPGAGSRGKSLDIQAGSGDDDGVGGFAGGGEVTVDGGTAGGQGGSVSVYAGWAKASSGADGGDVLLWPGTGDGGGRQGLLILKDIPTSDPGVSGALWVDGSNFLKVSP